MRLTDGLRPLAWRPWSAEPGAAETALHCARLVLHASFLTAVLDVFTDRLDEAEYVRLAGLTTGNGATGDGKKLNAFEQLAEIRDYADADPDAGQAMLTDLLNQLKDS